MAPPETRCDAMRVPLVCCVFCRLDEYGRQVDSEGKVVRLGPVMTLKANRLGSKAHNPYLQHRTVCVFLGMKRPPRDRGYREAELQTKLL